MIGRAAVVLLAALAAPGWASGVTPEAKGLQIAEEMDARDSGWGDEQAEVEMVLRDRAGKESRRALRTRSLEVEGDGDKVLIVFDSPRDLAGTVFLSYAHADRPDDQWLYLPALKRVKRIASVNQSGPFMGSEFAYEDLSSQELAKYSYRWLRDEELDGRPTLVIERTPAYAHSGYSRQVVWVSAEIYRPLRIDYFDHNADLLKTLTLHDYGQHLDSYWRAERMEMINHQTGKGTSLHWRDFRFRTGLTESDFRKESLRRIR